MHILFKNLYMYIRANNTNLVNTGNLEPIICSLIINNVHVVTITTSIRLVASAGHDEKPDLPLSVHPTAC